MVFTFDPSVEEAPMDLLDLDNKHVFYILMHDQLCQPVLVLSVSITQTDLLIIFAVEADRGLVEVLHEVLKSDPENTV